MLSTSRSNDLLVTFNKIFKKKQKAEKSEDFYYRHKFVDHDNLW